MIGLSELRAPTNVVIIKQATLSDVVLTYISNGIVIKSTITEVSIFFIIYLRKFLVRSFWRDNGRWIQIIPK